MAEVTLVDAAGRLAISPLQLMVRCALRGIPCETAILDEDVLPVLGTVRTAEAVDQGAGTSEQIAPRAEGLTDRDRRLRVVRRILEKLSVMGKYWPARTERRSTARGLEASDVGLALRAVDVLCDCGLLVEESRGGRETRVGLDGDRRREITGIVSGEPVADERLRQWIEEG